jgi:hypothetical protein
VIGLGFLLALVLGVPALFYLLDRRRRARTDAERDDDAVWAAQHHEGPGTHDPLSGPPIQPPSS